MQAVKMKRAIINGSLSFIVSLTSWSLWALEAASACGASDASVAAVIDIGDTTVSLALLEHKITALTLRQNTADLRQLDNNRVYADNQSAYSADVDALGKQFGVIHGENLRLQREVYPMKIQIQKLEGQIQSLTGENVRLRSQLDEQQRALSDLAERYAIDVDALRRKMGLAGDSLASLPARKAERGQRRRQSGAVPVGLLTGDSMVLDETRASNLLTNVGPTLKLDSSLGRAPTEVATTVEDAKPVKRFGTATKLVLSVSAIAGVLYWQRGPLIKLPVFRSR